MSCLNSFFDQKAVNTIRMLSVDAVEKASVGHPGMPMGAAPIGYVLWTRHMKHNPSNPHWFNRDRFVLSAGHGSMLLYSLLHLCGYDLPMEEIRQFRQWGSLTPGHPEVGHTPGVDATTGPLGQGLAMAVGMAMTEAHLSAVYNRDGFNVVDHHTYVICGDGDLMEGVSSEAASLAGHLKLGKLIVLYDSNDVTLDGRLSLAFSENIRHRFESYDWQYLRVENENDLEAISSAIENAKSESTRPTLIEVKTTIGYGSPNKAGKGGHSGPHGSPLGPSEVILTKKALGWPDQPDFYVPKDVKIHFSKVKNGGETVNTAWDILMENYKKSFPELALQLEMAMCDQLPSGWDSGLTSYSHNDAPISTRMASGKALNAIAQNLPTLFGGSADLETSTYTHLESISKFSPEGYNGRNVYYGVREFAMAAAINGMNLHGGVKPYGGTFLVFSDYLRPAIRLGAIMKVPSMFVFSHDSIAVGEDGPTHQPIEQIPALRVIPNVTVIRPADGNETVEAWRVALTYKGGPICFILSRQDVPILPGSSKLAREGVSRGAYVLSDGTNSKLQAQIIATGSEVHLALEAQKMLLLEGIEVRVISMPSWELFERQSKEYKDSVILPDVKIRLAIEMAFPIGWERYVGSQGEVMGIQHFVTSAKGSVVMKEYGFEVNNVVTRIKSLLG